MGCGRQYGQTVRCLSRAAGRYLMTTSADSAPALSKGLALRRFSRLPSRRADEGQPNSSTTLENALRSGKQAPRSTALDILSKSLKLGSMSTAYNQPRIDTSSLEEALPSSEASLDDSEEPFHFHVYSHKHNTHVTVTKPNRDAIISASCGNLGFKKANRKHYDSAYQLGAYVIDKLHQGDWHNRIKRLEVVLRGFGAGREAVTKVLMSNEGRLWRPKVVRVSDATRLKIGGTRSKRPRRLG